MATNCEDVSAQMMELLYGELPAGARASVDAHVAGCARCRAELDGFEKTRALARRGLDEAPPARARAAIMQAAAAHLAAQAQAQTHAQAQAQPAARRAEAAPEKVSFWDRIRARWAFPTLATVGALALFLVANKMFMHPEQALEKAHRAEAPAATTPPEITRSSPPSPIAEAKPVTQGSPPADMFAGGAASPAPPVASAPRRHRRGGAEPPPSRIDDLMGGADKDVAVIGDRPGPAWNELAKKKKAEEPAARFAEPPPAKVAAPEPEAASASRDQGLGRREFAPPPPPRESKAAKKPAKEYDKAAAMAQEESVPLGSTTNKSAPRAATADPLMAGEAEKASTGRAGGGLGTGSAAGPKSKADGFGPSGAAQAAAPPRPQVAKPVPPPPPAPSPSVAAPAAAPTTAAAPPVVAQQPQRKARVKSNVDPFADDEGAWPAQEGDAKAEKKQASGGKGAANETLLQRADRLFAAGRWAEAAAAYRELLHRDPHSDDADRWRKRLAVAENADLSERNANVAQKRAAEASRSRKQAPAQAAPAKAAPAKGSKAAASEATE